MKLPTLALLLLLAVSPACDAPPDAPGSDVDAPGVLAPATCVMRERALVVASDAGRVAAIAGYHGAWTDSTTMAPTSTHHPVGFEDQYHAFGAFWVDPADGASRYRRWLPDGTLSAPSDPQQFIPLADAHVTSIGPLLVARTQNGVASSWFDPDGFTFSPLTPTGASPGFRADVSAVLTGNYNLMIAGVDEDGTVFDQAFYENTSWLPRHRHAGLISAASSEIPTSGPQLVAFPGGDDDVVLIANSSAQGIVAVTRTADVWSPPVPLGNPYITTFAAVATADGDALVVGVDAASESLVLARFSRTTGWQATEVLDHGASTDPRAITLATGICGDDALVVYGTPHDVRSVRVRGALHSDPAVVAAFAPSSISTTTRAAGE